MNWIHLEVETYDVRIYQDSVRDRHYYELTIGKLEFEIGELVFWSKSERDQSDSF